MIPRLAFLLVLTALAGCIPEGQPGPVSPGASALRRSSQLRRGINVGNALDAPTEGAWGPGLDAPLFDAIAAAGFDHVRIPVRFSAHAASSPPFAVDEAFFRRVEWAVDQAQARGMMAIVDLHHYEELTKQPDAHAARFVGLWKQIAARLRARPASVVYELLNEPNGDLTPARWNALLVGALRAVREVDPERTVIIDSAAWAAAKELAEALQVPGGDPHLVGSFHMYQPILFTHQGMPWMPPEFGTTGIVFPSPSRAPVVAVPAAEKVSWVSDWLRRYNTLPAEQNPSGPAAIAEQFEYARAFAERTGLAVYMGEFGAGDKADMASRVTWTRMVRREAERRGIGWAYWDDGGRFKAYDRATHTWSAELRAALLE
jgi:endoglucanase